MSADRHPAEPPPPSRWISLGLPGLLLGSLGFLTLGTLERVKYVLLENRSAGGRSLAALVQTLQLVDLAAAGVAVLAALGIVWAEWRHRAITRTITAGRPWELACLLAMIAAWTGHALLAEGLPVTGDASAHIVRINHLAAAIRDGSSLYWDNYSYAGATLLQFTGPVFHWLAAGLTLLVGDAPVATKWLVAALHVGATFTAYALFRELAIGRFGAFFGAVAYSGAYAFAYFASVRSSYPQVLHMALFPIVLLAADALVRSRRSFGWPWWTLCLSSVALIGNHQPTAVMGGLLTAIFVGARIVALKAPWSRLGRFAVAAAAIAACSAFFVVPFLGEAGSTAETTSVSVLRLVPPALGHIVNYLRPVQTGAGTGADYSAPLGLVTLLVALAGIVALRRGLSGETRAAQLIALGLLVVTLFLAGSYVRTSVFVLIFAAMAAACGASGLADRAGTRAAAIVLALLVIETSLSGVQPWIRRDFRKMAETSSVIAHTSAAQRVVQVALDNGPMTVSVGPDSTPLYYDRVQSLSGPHKMDATKAHNAVSAALKVIESDLRSRNSLGPAARRIAELMNVGLVVGTRGSEFGLPPTVADAATDGVLGRHLRIARATPVVAGGRLQAMAPPPALTGTPLWNDSFELKLPEAEASMAFLRRYAEAMDAGGDGRVLGAIPVADVPPGPEWQHAGEPPKGFALIDYKLGPGTVSLRVRSDTAGYLRLAHPAHPSIVATRDGVPVAIGVDPLHFIVLALPQGEHRFELAATPSTLRRACFWITVAGTAILLVGAGVSLWQRGRARQP